LGRTETSSDGELTLIGIAQRLLARQKHGHHVRQKGPRRLMTDASMPAANAKNPSQIELLSSVASMLLPAVNEKSEGTSVRWPTQAV
jgi:hypothetical protein